TDPRARRRATAHRPRHALQGARAHGARRPGREPVGRPGKRGGRGAAAAPPLPRHRPGRGGPRGHTPATCGRLGATPPRVGTVVTRQPYSQVRFTDWWVRCYTRVLPEDVRDQRRRVI